MPTNTHKEAELLAKLFSGEYELKYRKPFIREREEGTQRVYILELRKGDRLIAYGKLVTLCFTSGIVSAYMRVFVHNGFRSQHIGTCIFDAIIETAIQQRVTRLELRSGKPSQRQCEFLKRNHFSGSGSSFVRILPRVK